ncbi:hypothetical protein [Xenorhabdus bovienii]|uniref:hypothetical protein n=1 Tax=Xenorhabdus bovienii TaxID=40576 RepID=UPI003DA1D822
MERSGLGEADLPNGVFKKSNEKGVRGIGINVLKEVNENIIGAKYETWLKADKYIDPKLLPTKALPICKSKKKGRK